MRSMFIREVYLIKESAQKSFLNVMSFSKGGTGSLEKEERGRGEEVT